MQNPQFQESFMILDILPLLSLLIVLSSSVNIDLLLTPYSSYIK